MADRQPQSEAQECDPTPHKPSWREVAGNGAYAVPPYPHLQGEEVGGMAPRSLFFPLSAWLIQGQSMQVKMVARVRMQQLTRAAEEKDPLVTSFGRINRKVKGLPFATNKEPCGPRLLRLQGPPLLLPVEVEDGGETPCALAAEGGKAPIWLLFPVWQLSRSILRRAEGAPIQVSAALVPQVSTWSHAYMATVQGMGIPPQLEPLPERPRVQSTDSLLLLLEGPQEEIPMTSDSLTVFPQPREDPLALAAILSPRFGAQAEQPPLQIKSSECSCSFPMAGSPRCSASAECVAGKRQVGVREGREGSGGGGRLRGGTNLKRSTKHDKRSFLWPE